MLSFAIFLILVGSINCQITSQNDWFKLDDRQTDYYGINGNRRQHHRFEHLSEDSAFELESIGRRLSESIDPEKWACESYYDFVCGKQRPLFSVMNTSPPISDLARLLKAISEDDQHFESKTKLLNFFKSCGKKKSLEECYRESFEYFKPLYGYIVERQFIDVNDKRNFMDVFQRFMDEANRFRNFSNSALKFRFEILRDKLRSPEIFFRPFDLDFEYKNLAIYPESYHYNIKNIEQFRKATNLSYEYGLEKKVLDFTLYLDQSRNKPMSYYYATLNVHLWMVVYNSTANMNDREFKDTADCLRLPAYLNALDEARNLAVIYLKSFRQAYTEYTTWIDSRQENAELFDEENHLLRDYFTDNKKIFFTIYAQNFCDFGKEIAENIFYQGLKHNRDFGNIYSCGVNVPMNPMVKCA